MADTQKFLKVIMEDDKEVGLEGKCHDCGVPVYGLAFYDEAGNIKTDIPFWHVYDTSYCKCDECFNKEPMLKNYQECEIFTRVCGYLRPVRQFNPGKKAEKLMRKDFKL